MKKNTDQKRAVKALLWNHWVHSNRLRALVMTHKATNRLNEAVQQWGLDMITRTTNNGDRCVEYFLKSTNHNKEVVKMLGIEK